MSLGLATLPSEQLPQTSVTPSLYSCDNMIAKWICQPPLQDTNTITVWGEIQRRGSPAFCLGLLDFLGIGTDVALVTASTAQRRIPPSTACNSYCRINP